MRRLARRLQNAGTALHCAVLRVSGWRLGGRISELPVVLLTTRGRRSGKARTVPLMFLDEDGYVLVGSNGGAVGDPGWVLNLRARPEATIEGAAGRVAVRAERVLLFAPEGQRIRTHADRGAPAAVIDTKIATRREYAR